MQQTTIFDAIAARDAAISAIVKAETFKDWKPVAWAFLVSYATSIRGEFTGEDLVDAFSATHFMQPRDARWWGPLFIMATHQGVIEEVRRGAQRRKGHGTSGAIVYRRPA